MLEQQRSLGRSAGVMREGVRMKIRVFMIVGGCKDGEELLRCSVACGGVRRKVCVNHNWVMILALSMGVQAAEGLMMQQVHA